MAIKQSDWALGRRITPVSGEAGEVVVERFSFTVSANLAANDIIELGVLPAFAYPVDAVLVTDDLGAITLDVGIMSGSVGDQSQSRTSGNELYAAAAPNAVVRMSKASAFRMASVDADRSVGVKVSGSVTASGQVVTLLLYYRQ